MSKRKRVSVTGTTKKKPHESRRGGKKNRKWGRNEAKCKRYRLEDRREKNKDIVQERIARRLEKRASKRSLKSVE